MRQIVMFDILIMLQNQDDMVAAILEQFGLNDGEYTVQKLDSGLINKTWKVSTGDKSYILQRINAHVFKKPEDIDGNLSRLKHYLMQQFPDYLFVAPVAAPDGRTLISSGEGYFRLFDFVDGSRTLSYVKTSEEACEAARQFGKFSRLLSGFNADELTYTLPDFHNLTLRYEQFTEALEHATEGRLEKAKDAISFIRANEGIVHTFNKVLADQSIPHRVVHHDTKISNVLFDADNKGLCVIDLDTVMPGFYISDTGDMMRTYLSPANEEETDLSKVMIRKDFFQAIYEGYFSEMGVALNEAEKTLFIYSGEFIIYMQAIRFLTDYLNNDIYYGARHAEHNLDRAINQISLLEKYMDSKDDFRAIIEQSQPEPA
jgi:Ser/Thr protein kinase RdoA (MazF antagonist)